jgi:ABC-2 type transport system ATP-binding protein
MPMALMDRRIDALLELFGLSDTAEQGIASYSKGMKQKILVIGALLHDPDLLIFDEPDTGLDVTSALVLRHLIANLAARGKAILYTSHILDVVEKLCTRVIVLHEGRVVADDSVQQLRTVLASGSLEEVFARLVLRRDPEKIARDIADVVTVGV